MVAFLVLVQVLDAVLLEVVRKRLPVIHAVVVVLAAPVITVRFCLLVVSIVLVLLLVMMIAVAIAVGVHVVVLPVVPAVLRLDLLLLLHQHLKHHLVLLYPVR